MDILISLLLAPQPRWLPLDNFVLSASVPPLYWQCWLGIHGNCCSVWEIAVDGNGWCQEYPSILQKTKISRYPIFEKGNIIHSTGALGGDMGQVSRFVGRVSWCFIYLNPGGFLVAVKQTILTIVYGYKSYVSKVLPFLLAIQMLTLGYSMLQQYKKEKNTEITNMWKWFHSSSFMVHGSP